MKEKRFSRRSFLQLAAAVGATATVSAGLATIFEKMTRAWADEAPARKIYATSCHSCIKACPCRVYVEDGVVVKIEGHPLAPTNQGSMCLKGLNEMHAVYSPRRVLYPLKRVGARGAENASWERISWDDALKLAGSKIAEAIEKYGSYAFITSTGGGGLYTGMEANSVNLALGSPNCFEPGGPQCWMPRYEISRYMYGGASQSMADEDVVEPFKGLSPFEQAKGLKNDTQCLVLWGAQPSVSQTAESGRGMAELRARGAKTVVIDPNLSPDAAKATLWLRIRPGSDGAMMLTWFRYIFENELYDKEFVQFWTNLPFVLNPDTNLPYYAQEVFPDFVQSTPANTPAYVCFDRHSKTLAPFEFSAPASATVDPEPFWCGEVLGTEAFTAGQLYKETADPWTLSKAEETCWVPADLIEAGIRLYATGELPVGKEDASWKPAEPYVAGIVHGVATDMQQNSSQACLGAMGLDMVMGYINKPGTTLTQNFNAIFSPPPGTPATRPVTMFNNFGGAICQIYGLGYAVGATREENEARIAALPTPPPFVPSFPGSQGMLYLMNQLWLDRLGMKNHKGSNGWVFSHIPSTLMAILTGAPYKPRVIYDMSGNKLAMIGNAAGWHDAFNEMDFVIGSHPIMTSFHVEHVDLMLPVEEWVEYPDMSTSNSLRQMNYNFGRIPVIHLGETVSSSVVPTKVVNAASTKLNEYLESGERIVIGSVGAVTGPNPDDATAAQETGNWPGASILHDCDQSRFTLHFPLGIGVMNGEQEDIVEAQAVADYYAEQCGAEPRSLAFSELFEDYDIWREKMDAATFENKGWCEVPPEVFWQYGQHLEQATDGLPVGFGTESRKCEVYCSTLIRMAADGYPYYYPRTMEPVDANIGEEIKAIQPGYRFVGSYSPICQHIEPAESPLPGYPGYDPEYPLVLTSGRVNYFHHGTARHLPFARELYPTPEVRINPATATHYGMEPLDWVEITSARGSTRGQVVFNAGMDERVVWMERFWFPEAFDDSQAHKTGGWRESNVNLLTKGTAPFNEVFGSMTYRGFLVKIAKSTKPDNVWIAPEEFRPFMPTQANVYTPDIGTTIGSEITPMVTFTDWDPSAPAEAH